MTVLGNIPGKHQTFTDILIRIMLVLSSIMQVHLHASLAHIVNQLITRASLRITAIQHKLIALKIMPPPRVIRLVHIHRREHLTMLRVVSRDKT